MSLDPLTLEIKSKSLDLNERKYAQALLPIRKQHHLLLVSLLLIQSMTSEALPLFIDELSGSITAIIISMFLVLVCGEIIPNSICTGPRKLEIAYNLR